MMKHTVATSRSLAFLKGYGHPPPAWFGEAVRCFERRGSWWNFPPDLQGSIRAAIGPALAERQPYIDGLADEMRLFAAGLMPLVSKQRGRHVVLGVSTCKRPLLKLRMQLNEEPQVCMWTWAAANADSEWVRQMEELWTPMALAELGVDVNVEIFTPAVAAWVYETPNFGGVPYELPVEVFRPHVIDVATAVPLLVGDVFENENVRIEPGELDEHFRATDLYNSAQPGPDPAQAEYERWACMSEPQRRVEGYC